MKKSALDRRSFLQYTATAATGLGLLSAVPKNAIAGAKAFAAIEDVEEVIPKASHDNPRIKFAVIGINHGHIYSQVDAVVRGGGQLVSV